MSFRKNSFGKSNFRKGRSLKAASSLILCGTTSIGMMTLNGSSNINAGWWDGIVSIWKWLFSWIGLSTQKEGKNLSTVIERPECNMLEKVSERHLIRLDNGEASVKDEDKNKEDVKGKELNKEENVKEEKKDIKDIEENKNEKNIKNEVENVAKVSDKEDKKLKDVNKEKAQNKKVQGVRKEILVTNFKQAAELLKKEYPENFEYNSKDESIHGEYTGDVSVQGDLKLSVSIKKLDPNLNEGNKYQAEFFGRKFYFKTDEDLFEHIQKHMEYRKKLKSYIEKFKEIAATGKFTLKVVKEKQEIIDTHKIVLEIVDWGNLRFKERNGSCVSGFEIVLDHCENEPVVVECYNAYMDRTPFYSTYNDGVNVFVTNYAFSRPSNEESLNNLFEDLLVSVEDYGVQYVKRTKEVFGNVFGKIEWKPGENDGEWKGSFKIKGVSFPVIVYASKGPENYGEICGKKFLGNYLPKLEEYNDWVSHFKYLFESCYEKFKMCEKGENFKVSVGKGNVIVLKSTNEKSVINVPGALLGDCRYCENYPEKLSFDKKDTVAVDKIEFDVVNKKISIYSEDKKKYCYKLDDFGAWHLALKKDAPFKTRFNKFLDHLVAEVEKMVAKEEERKQREAEEVERKKRETEVKKTEDQKVDEKDDDGDYDYNKEDEEDNFSDYSFDYGRV